MSIIYTISNPAIRTEVRQVNRNYSNYILRLGIRQTIETRVIALKPCEWRSKSLFCIKK